jgi:myo-inositol-1(or 4)-monophosphatase
MEPMIRVASAAARKASEVITRAFRDIDLIKVEKKAPTDFVTAVDRAVEQILIEEIKERFPDHKFIGEESGISGNADSEVEWIIDPLDGTTNFVRGIPQFAISIGCKINGRLEHGLILDPIRDDEFSASRGQGARLNGKRIRVSDAKTLEGALLATGIPFGKATMPHIEAYLKCTEELLKKDTCGIRRLGAASLDLAYLAAGRFDGFYEIDLKPWDIAAGILIVREAGGLVADLSGADKHLESGHILCANPKVFKEMLPIVKRNLGHLNA